MNSDRRKKGVRVIKKVMSSYSVVNIVPGGTHCPGGRLTAQETHKMYGRPPLTPVRPLYGCEFWAGDTLVPP